MDLGNISVSECGEHPLGMIATWQNSSQNNTYENHQNTIANLTVDKDAGEIIFNVKVDVNIATPFVNSDSGEEITVLATFYTLSSYELTEAS